MKMFVFIIGLIALIISEQAKEKFTPEELMTYFNETLEDIYKIEYSVVVVDTFPNGTVWYSPGGQMVSGFI